MNEAKGFNFDRLDNANYFTWALRMKHFLLKEGLFGTLETTEEIVLADIKKDEKALNFIVLGVDNGQLVHLTDCSSGRAAWKKLKSVHVQTTLTAQIRIMRQLFNSKLTEDSTMKEHLQKLFDFFNQLATSGFSFDGKISVAIVLSSLGSDYEPLITALEAWDEEKLTLEAVRSKLIEEYSRKQSVDGTGSTASALKVDRKPRTCTFCKKKGHLESYCYAKQRSISQPDEQSHMASFAFMAAERRVVQRRKKISKRMCYNCSEYGHFSATCQKIPSVKSFVGKNLWINKEVQSAKMLRLNKFYNYVSLHNKQPSSTFVLDSGCSTHMCCDANLFQELKMGSFGDIMIASGETISSKGRGTVKVIAGIGLNIVELILLNVLFVPELHTNLLSIRKITENNLSVIFTNFGCHLKARNKTFLIGKFVNGLYTLIQPQQQCAVTQCNSVCIHDWHRKMAHRHLGDVRKMSTFGIKISKCNCNDTCEACVQGKMSRLPFSKSAEKKTKRLECIVSDLCGPMQTESIGKSKYFITFTDVFSGYTEVSFIRSKDQAADKTIEFIERCITSTKETPIVFRSDRGTEFTNKHLQNFLASKGISFECTTPYSPQQNGIAERKNRTLVEAARTMLIAAQMPNKFWAEAVHHATDTFNKMIKGNMNLSPYELFFQKKPSLEFHEFGCDVFVMKPDALRRKLDVKADKMRFVGFDNNSKGYRVLNSNNAIKISRDVKFILTDPSLRDCVDASINAEPSQPSPISENKNLVLLDETKSSVSEDELAPLQDIEPFENGNIDFVDQQSSVINISSDESNMYDSTLDYSCHSSFKQSPSTHNFVLSATSDVEEPKTFNQALINPRRENWLKAMNEELNAIEKNQTWTLVDLPDGRKAIGCKWVFKLKRDEKGEIARFKARLVAQGFSQKYGVDYDEVFAPVARSTTLRVLLSFAGRNKYIVKHFDVKTAFLNGILDEDIYMRQPQGFKKGDKVLKLNKSLYGLKQAARVWNITLHQQLLNIGFIQNNIDKCLYVLRERNSICYLIVHVDDLLFVSNREETIKSSTELIGNKFELKDLGNVHHYLGIDISRDTDGNFSLSQPNYIKNIVSCANLDDAKPSKFPVDTGYFKLDDNNFLNTNNDYRKLIGMLLYLTTHSRPDIAASVSILSQRVSNPRQVDFNEVKRLIRYLKGTVHLKLTLSDKSRTQKLFAFSDANWAECPLTRKSNTGYACMVNGGMVAWCCRKQDLVSLSSTEAEYIALSETCKEIIWLKILIKFFIPDNSPTEIFTDSQSCLKFIKNDKFSNRTKHIDTKFHFVKDCVSNDLVYLNYVETNENIADMFTKPLGSVKLKYLRELAGIYDLSPSRGGVEIPNHRTMTDKPIRLKTSE